MIAANMDLEMKLNPQRVCVSPLSANVKNMANVVVEATIIGSQSGHTQTVYGNGTLVYRNGVGHFVYTCAHFILASYHATADGDVQVGILEEPFSMKFRVHHPSKSHSISASRYELGNEFLETIRESGLDERGMKWVPYTSVMKFDYAILKLDESIVLPDVPKHHSELVKTLDFKDPVFTDIVCDFYGSVGNTSIVELCRSLGVLLKRKPFEEAYFNFRDTVPCTFNGFCKSGMSGNSCMLEQSEAVAVGILICGGNQDATMILLSNYVIAFFNNFIRNEYEEGHIRDIGDLMLSELLMDTYRPQNDGRFEQRKRKRMVRRDSRPLDEGSLL